MTLVWFRDGGVYKVLQFNSNNHVLFTFLAKIFVKVFGVIGFSLRAPSVIGAAGYLPATYFLSRRVFGDGLLFLFSVAMVCLNPQIMAEGNRNVVVDQLPATTGEDGPTADQAGSLLLAIVGREPSDAATVWKHAAADGGFAAAIQVGASARRTNLDDGRGVGGEVSVKSLRTGTNDAFLTPAKALTGTLGSFALERTQKRSRAEATGGILVLSREAKWKLQVNSFRWLRRSSLACLPLRTHEPQ